MDCNQAGDSRSLSVDAAYQVARSFGCNHKDSHIFSRYDFVKVNIKSVSKLQRIASFQIRGDTLFKNCSLKLVRIRTMTISPLAAASAVSSTSSPSFFASSHDELSFLRPTTTSTPLSFRFSA